MQQSNPGVSKEEVVVDVAKTRISDLWKKEDYWAIWLGTFILLTGLLLFLNNPPAGMKASIDNFNSIMHSEAQKTPFKTVAWHQASMNKGKIRATNEKFAANIKKLLDAPYDWKTNSLNSIYQSEDTAKAKNAAAEASFKQAETEANRALATARASEAAAAHENFSDVSLNDKAQENIQSWLQAVDKASKAKRKISNSPYNRIISLAGLGIILALFFSIGIKIMAKPVIPFLTGFGFVYILAVLALIVEVQQTMKLYGFGYPLWAIIFGMLISNTVGTPQWVKPAVQTEYFIKTGLVLLGAEILFSKILTIGLPGIFVAWIVTPIVLVITFWFGQHIVKIPSKTLNITVSADMSVCGVSAAIATASACRAKKEELTLAIGLSMVFTAIMMIALPTFIKALGMPEVLGGAWIGGTIDSTGAVAAAGAFLGDRAMYVAATVKMIQNVMIGVIAFCVAVYWCARVDCAPGQKVSWMEIWYRFPKFVLGFIGLSIIFSIIDTILGKDVSNVVIDHGVLRGFSRPLREWFFCLAFISIGLGTNFRELKQYFKGGKPLILYVCGQTFNLILTLIMAYIMFYLVFPDITEKI